jgi:uncharacterized protein
MSTATAEASVEMLLKESPDETRYSVVFFGGEPLSNRPLIEHMVAYCERRFAEAGKQVEFIMTTNATLLTEETSTGSTPTVSGCPSASTGPRPCTTATASPWAGRAPTTWCGARPTLLSRYDSRPVGARVTLTRGITDVETIWNHLFNEMGFAEVGLRPGDLR